MFTNKSNHRRTNAFIREADTHGTKTHMKITRLSQNNPMNLKIYSSYSIVHTIFCIFFSFHKYLAIHVESKMYLEGDKIVIANDVLSKAHYIASGSCLIVHPNGAEEPVETSSVVGEKMLFSPAGTCHFSLDWHVVTHMILSGQWTVSIHKHIQIFSFN